MLKFLEQIIFEISLKLTIDFKKVQNGKLYLYGNNNSAVAPDFYRFNKSKKDFLKKEKNKNYDCGFFDYGLRSCGIFRCTVEWTGSVIQTASAHCKVCGILPCSDYSDLLYNRILSD